MKTKYLIAIIILFVILTSCGKNDNTNNTSSTSNVKGLYNSANIKINEKNTNTLYLLA